MTELEFDYKHNLIILKKILQYFRNFNNFACYRNSKKGGRFTLRASKPQKRKLKLCGLKDLVKTFQIRYVWTEKTSEHQGY